MKRKSSAMNGETGSGSVSIRKCDKPVDDCSICCSRRPIAADAFTYALPLSGERVSRKFENWWKMKAPDRHHNLNGLAALTAVPMCQPCLDLVLEVERCETQLDSSLALLWDRLKASKLVHSQSKREVVNDYEGADMIRAAALAAGIIEDIPAYHEDPAEQPMSVFQPSFQQPQPVQTKLEVDEPSGEFFSSNDVVGEEEEEKLVVKRRPVKKTRPTRRAAQKQVKEKEEGVQTDDDATQDYGTIVINPVHQKPPPDEEPPPEFDDFEAFNDVLDQSDDGEVEVMREIAQKPKKKRQRKKPMKPIEIPEEEITFGTLPPEDRTQKRERGKYQPMTMCPICGKMLKGDFSKVFKKHVSLVHKQEKKFHCQFCEEVFKYRTSLYVHQKNVHQYGTERVSRPCQLCGKLIAATFGMKQHLLTVHNIVHGGSKTYDCNRCEKRFLTPSRLTEHLNSHDGIRPYGCPLCEVRMVRLENLQQHVRRVHKRAIRLKRREDPGEEPNVELVELVPLNMQVMQV